MEGGHSKLHELAMRGIPTVALGALQSIPVDALEQNKYAIIWDKQGSVGTFMKIKMSLYEMDVDLVKKAAGSMTGDDCLNALRKRIVAAMLHGSNLGIMLAKMRPDFNDELSKGPTNFNANRVFDFNSFRQREEYRSLLMDDDLKDVMGNNCQRESWDMNEKF